jgi:hypothetical protein
MRLAQQRPNFWRVIDFLQIEGNKMKGFVRQGIL